MSAQPKVLEGLVGQRQHLQLCLRGNARGCGAVWPNAFRQSKVKKDGAHENKNKCPSSMGPACIFLAVLYMPQTPPEHGQNLKQTHGRLRALTSFPAHPVIS